MSLAYSIHSGTGIKTPLFILHGLLGSKTNWNSIAKVLCQKTIEKVVTLDVRNHGESPHLKGMDYVAMASDVQTTATELGFSKINLMGHSMGGKIAMTLALSQQANLIDKLILVDVAPVNYKTVLQYGNFLDAMQSVNFDLLDASLAKARKSLDQQLSNAIKEEAMRKFILTNLVKRTTGYAWRVDVQEILWCLSDLSNFPELSNSFHGPTIFIGGANSDYIKRNTGEILKFFPNSEVAYVENAGHWVHADNPQGFLNVLIRFLTTENS